MSHSIDLFIIGAGPAGLAAAKQAAKAGLQVAIAEQTALGGSCVNRGCIPKKLMVYAADAAAAFQTAAAYGWEGGDDRTFHWQRFRERRDRELQRLQQVQQEALESAGVQQLQGQARFLDPHTLTVAGETYTADRILIAVGGKPMRPDIPGIDLTLTSDQLLTIEQLPARIAILGGGYIGVEFASILRGFGCDVTLMNREACILEGFDADLRAAVRQGLIRRGIHSLCSTTAKAIAQTPEGLRLQLIGDGVEHPPQPLVVDTVLCAIGRAPNLDDLGLAQAGVTFDQKAIAVDDHSRTSQPHIYAVGDCTNRKQLTPVARAEGRAAVDAMLGCAPAPLDDTLVPSAVLSRPEAASVGLSEEQAKQQYGEAIACYSKTFTPLRETLLKDQQQAFLKLVVDNNSDRLLGIHMVGEDAAEIVQAGAIALQKAMTHHELLHTLSIHPSTAEELFAVQPE